VDLRLVGFILSKVLRHLILSYLTIKRMISAWKRVYEINAYTTMNIRDKADVSV
jgi:hypothetical protein